MSRTGYTSVVLPKVPEKYDARDQTETRRLVELALFKTTNTSVADSKTTSSVTATSVADSKAVSVGTANLAGSAGAPATSGAMTVVMTTALVVLTPSGDCTFNADRAGTSGQRIGFVITTSGAVSFTMTFGTAFKPNGTLATGTVTGKTFVLVFLSNGTVWIEESRTTAL